MADEKSQYDPPALFVHTPKTGGTSISRLPWVASMGHRTWWISRMRFPEQWEKSFRFGFVRNPWARMASFFWSAGESEFARRPDRRHDLDFVRQQFRAWMHTKGLERLADPNMNAQHQLVLPGGGLQVHFVGRTECMVEDLTYVAEKIGQKVPDPLPRENVFKLDVPHWREMYDNDTSRIVRTLSTFEVHYLRYTFEEDLPARRASIGEP